MENLIIFQQIRLQSEQRFRLDPITGRLERVTETISVPNNQQKCATYEQHFRGEIIFDLPKHSDCLILREPIEPGEMYHKCSKCEQSISVEGMRSWWEQCKKDKKQTTCPSCREIWKNRTLFVYSY